MATSDHQKSGYNGKIEEHGLVCSLESSHGLCLQWAVQDEGVGNVREQEKQCSELLTSPQQERAEAPDVGGHDSHLLLVGLQFLLVWHRVGELLH